MKQPLLPGSLRSGATPLKREDDTSQRRSRRAPPEEDDSTYVGREDDASTSQGVPREDDTSTQAFGGRDEPVSREERTRIMAEPTPPVRRAPPGEELRSERTVVTGLDAPRGEARRAPGLPIARPRSSPAISPRSTPIATSSARRWPAGGWGASSGPPIRTSAARWR
jgi:hypothetical protein